MQCKEKKVSTLMCEHNLIHRLILNSFAKYIKERGSVPPRPEKTHKTVTEISGMLQVYIMRTELLPLFDYLYLSHKTFPMNDFLHGL